MNIILCIIDTLRYDYISAYGKNDWIQTPNIDRLASKSWVFDRAYVASYPTIPYRTDVMTGQYGGPFHPWMPLRFDMMTLPRVLAQAGYCTQFIHDTPHLVNGGHAFDWPFHAWTFVRGAEADRPWIDDKEFIYLDNWATDPVFDFVGDPMQEVKDYLLWPLIWNYCRANRNRKQPEDWNVAKLFLTAVDFLRENAKRDNFFLWLDCFDPHEPWDAPPDFVRMYDKTPGYDGRIDPRSFWEAARNPQGELLPASARRRIKAQYSAKVSWMDRWFGELLQALEETRLDKRTAIIFTADHGTNVGERRKFGKDYPVNEQEGHVPMIVHVPGRSAGRSDLIAQPQDLFATVLGIAGVKKPTEADGHDLVALAEQDGASPRTVALAGMATYHWTGNLDQHRCHLGQRHDAGVAADHWAVNPDHIIFTVFGREWYLNFAVNPNGCRLFRYGSTEEVAAANPTVVEELRQTGLEELVRLRTDPKLVDWIRSGGQEAFPRECYTWPGPPNWRHYYEQSYKQW